MRDFWSVTVSMNGEEVVTLEPNMLAGKDIGKPEEEAIRTSAEMLLSFIGDYPTAALAAKDAEIERLREPLEMLYRGYCNGLYEPHPIWEVVERALGYAESARIEDEASEHGS